MDPDLERAMRVLRYWFGDVQVLAVVEGVPGDTSPGLASQQLALTPDEQLPRIDPPSRVRHGRAKRACP